MPKLKNTDSFGFYDSLKRTLLVSDSNLCVYSFKNSSLKLHDLIYSAVHLGRNGNHEKHQ